MISFGNVPLGSVLPIPFASYGKTDGQSITLTGLAVTDVEVYKGVSMTQRASDAGYALMDTDGIDIDGVTGFHGFSIDTGDNTDAGFFVAGSFYTVLVSAVTVDSQTVNFIAATFRLLAAEIAAGVADNQPLVTGVGYLGDFLGIETFHFCFNTKTTLAGSPVISVYQDNSTFEGTAGITLVPDFDGVVGLNSVTIDITAAGMGGAGDINVVIKAGTVGGASVVKAVVASFSVVKRSSLLPYNFSNRLLDMDASGQIYPAANSLTALALAADAVTEIQAGLATSTEVTSIQNNTRVVRVVPTVIERPDAGTVAYRIELLLYDAVGNMEAPDSAPTIALVNQAGTDLSARLDSATMALISTGRYRAIYTADVADTLEQLVWAFSVVEGGATRVYGNTTVIVDTTAVDFTSADRTKLNTLHDTRIPGVIQPQTGDSFARLGAPAGVSHAADLASVKSDAAAILVDTGTTLDGRIPPALTADGLMKSDMLRINGNAAAAAVLAILNGATIVYQGTVTGAATTTTLIDSGLTQADVDWWKGRIIIFTSVIPLQATDITAFDPALDKLTFTACTQAPTGATYVII